MAGVLYGLSRNQPWRETLRWGIAAGAAAARLDGSAVGSLSLVKQLVSQVKINVC
jgi:fructose-1-phosphate kinase PfkB-like protein